MYCLTRLDSTGNVPSHVDGLRLEFSFNQPDPLFDLCPRELTSGYKRIDSRVAKFKGNGVSHGTQAHPLLVVIGVVQGNDVTFPMYKG